MFCDLDNRSQIEMKMLGNGLKTLLILQITLITQNVELSVDVDTNEEHQNFKEIKLNLRNADNEQNNETGETNDKTDKVDGSEEELNKEAKDSVNNQMKLANSNEYSKNISDQVKEKKPITAPLWKFKDVPTITEEPGFDLTLEEMTKFKIWKDGVIPYYIDVVSFSDKVIRDKIRYYLYMVNSATNLHFIELPNPPTDDHERWVFFMNRRGLLGCADHTVKNFTNQGVQQVVLGYDCIATKGELAEAVMTIVGVPAQHNAPDRDNYINVNMDNIMPDKRYLFEKLRDDEWLFHDLEYDFESITHYDIHKYSANGRVTIDLKEKIFTDLEPAKAFSYTDLLKIKMLYNYITRNAKLQTLVCQRLFKTGSKFKGFIPGHKKLKPRKKSSRYLGIADSEGHDNEPLEKANEDKKQEQIDDGYNEQDEKHIDEDDTSNGNRDKYSEHNEEGEHNEEESNDEDKNLDEEKDDDLQSNPDQPVENQNETGHGYKTKLKINKKNDPLALLSDYDSGDSIQKLNLDISNKNLKPDPLSFLSDYQTGDERDRKRMLQRIKTQTLKYSSGRETLKFTNSGASGHLLKKPIYFRER